jgi:hypothetical protein
LNAEGGEQRLLGFDGKGRTGFCVPATRPTTDSSVLDSARPWCAYGSTMAGNLLETLEPASWSAWVPLGDAPIDAEIPPRPGLYRIRRVGLDGLDYVGQTGTGGMTLRKRLTMLRGIYRNVMPYSDPHTAGPGLWALRHREGCDFEVSTCGVEGDAPWRKALECCVISRYRQERGVSPTLNFGRMPPGYRKSSGNNRRLVLADRRFRGGPIEMVADEAADASLRPNGPILGDSQADDFGGHAWSAWRPILESITDARGDFGLYRIRAIGTGALVYIGQGGIAGRLRTHLATATAINRQAAALSGPLETSYVSSDRTPRQRLELENDLIAGHVFRHGTPPMAQFLG